MTEKILGLLIKVVAVIVIVWLVLWAIASVGFALPIMVVKGIWVIAVVGIVIYVVMFLRGTEIGKWIP